MRSVVSGPQNWDMSCLRLVPLDSLSLAYLQARGRRHLSTWAKNEEIERMGCHRILTLLVLVVVLSGSVQAASARFQHWLWHDVNIFPSILRDNFSKEYTDYLT